MGDYSEDRRSEAPVAREGLWRCFMLRFMINLGFSERPAESEDAKLFIGNLSYDVREN
jgi:hypothetical protein